MKRNGELTSKQLVTIILLVVGFAILLIFYASFPWRQEASKQACHQSVVMRATMPSVAQNMIQLNCKTSKICLTASRFGKCKEFEGSNDVRRIVVRSKEDIERALIQEMYDCWWMMGEGKISLFSRYIAETYGLSKIYPTCVICSRIAFADDIGRVVSEDELSSIDLIKYAKEPKREAW